MTSRSPDSAASTLACAASSTELNGTASSVCQRDAMAPTTSSRDRRLVLGDARHRIVGPPRDRGEPAGHEYTAPELPAGLHLAFPSSHSSASLVCHGATCCQPKLHRRCRCSSRRAGNEARFPASRGPGSHPPGVRWHFLALHEERVRGEHRAVAYRHAVENLRADTESAAGTDGDAVGLEDVSPLASGTGSRRPVLIVTSSPIVTRFFSASWPPSSNSLLPTLTPSSRQIVALERGAVEKGTHCRFQLEEAFCAPEVDLVDRAILRRQRAESPGGTFDQHPVGHAQKQDEQPCSARSPKRRRRGTGPTRKMAIRRTR